MSQQNKFEYSYSAPTESERREIEDIKKAYLPKDENSNKLKRLRTLDGRVRKSALFAALFFGISGTLVFGLGMAMILEWDIFIWGTVVGAVGCVLLVLAHPARKIVLKRLKAKYGQEILRLSEELLHEDKKS